MIWPNSKVEYIMKSEWFKQRNNGMDYAVADNNEFSQWRTLWRWLWTMVEDATWTRGQVSRYRTTSEPATRHHKKCVTKMLPKDHKTIPVLFAELLLLITFYYIFFVGKTQRDFDRFLRKFRHKQSAQCNWGLSFNLIMTSNEPQRRNLEQARRFDSSVIICLKSITIIGRRLWLWHEYKAKVNQALPSTKSE